jgi:hypothetical protein
VSLRTEETDYLMWHPFHIMPSHFTVDERLIHEARPSSNCRMSYGERVIRWFLRVTDDDGNYLPNVDQRTGMVIERRASGDDWLELKIRHQKDLGVRHVLDGVMRVRRNDWRSPVSLDFEQQFQGSRGIRNFRESGEWKEGLATLISRRKEAFVRSERADSLTSLYTLLADFPTHLEVHPKSSETSVLEDVSVINPRAKLIPIPRAVTEHPMARGLRGYALDYPANLPVEFWVNQHGAVIYVCVGPNRALFLQSMEDIS